MLCVGYFASNFVSFMWNSSWEKFKEKVFRLATYLPPVAAYIRNDSEKTVGALVGKFRKERKGKTFLALPARGLPK